MTDANIQTYSKADVVSHYENAEGLMPPEKVLFTKYAKDGLDILDIGVGGGRTTPYLAGRAASYLGLDYAPAMVEACKRRFPQYEFTVGDATNLEGIEDDSYDLTIFSFNGIDSIPTNQGRIEALKEMKRVTRPDGFIIISSHNARQLAVWPQLAEVGILRKLWRLVRAFGKSISIAKRHYFSPAWKTGHGYIADPVHGGLRNHVSTPESIAKDATMAGLQVVESVGAFAPLFVPRLFNNWETYVLRSEP